MTEDPVRGAPRSTSTTSAFTPLTKFLLIPLAGLIGYLAGHFSG